MRSTSKGNLTIRSPLQTEHDKDGEQKRDKRKGPDARNEAGPIPSLTSGAQQHEAGEHPGEERYTQINEDTLGNLRDNRRRGQVIFADLPATTFSTSGKSP
jgi:hypothetical protein